VIVFRPTLRFTVAHPAHWIALGFGAGLSPWAPGTAGTLLGWLLAWLAGPALGTPIGLVVIAVLFALGVWVCDVTGRHLGIADHGSMVWDEVVAFLLILAIIPASFAWQLAGFALFRLFDIAKPPPIRWLETRFKGGWGVMIDDLLAAAYALIVLAMAKRFLFP
jgi:phosphatidylglycerophosphatase A